MAITKAVIPVAGWATRFLPTVKSYAKHLIPVVDKPQIQLVVEELLGAGLTDICIVHRDGDTTIKDYFTPNPELENYLEKTGKQARLDSYRVMMSQINHLTFIPQDKNLPYGNGIPLICAKEFIGNDNFVYLWGDDVTIEDNPGNFLKQMISLFETNKADAVIGVQEVPWEEVEKYGTMKFHPNPQVKNQVIDIPEKLPREQAPSNIINGARFVTSPKVLPILEGLQLHLGEIWFTQAVSEMAKTGLVVAANYRDYDAEWMTTGDPLNWLKVNLAVALKHPDIGPKIKEVLKTL